MGPQEIYDRCMQGSLRKLVKGGLVYQYAINPYFVWCEANAPRSEKDPESPYMTLIFENGRVHEQEVCDLQFPGGVALDPTLYEQAFRQTLEALFQGEKYIKNGIVYFLPEGYVAVPDILEKKQGPSLLGDFHYEVIEVKSSRQIRTEHILQGAYYTFIMGIIQGVTPEAFSLVDGKKNREYFSYKEYEPLLQETIRSIKDIYQGKEVPPSKLNWPWSSYSLKKLLEQQHISLIPNLYQSHRQLLEQAGVNSLQDFFSLHALGVTGIHPQAMERYKRTAKAFLQHRHAFLEKPFLPEKPVEIFLDFEGVEELRLNGHKVSCDYLIGVLLREDG
ncbi:MAG: hypothetical protein HY520_00365, partial [Candidatus Aenigmarchaeota archaeon]|nr:hypothetical protein [Candidatus Aenigmarchaeota archaeon]